jgi:hypothetical protein
MQIGLDSGNNITGVHFLFSKYIYANVTVFIHFILAPASIVFPYPSFFFRTPDENDESRFHCISSV